MINVSSGLIISMKVLELLQKDPSLNSIEIDVKCFLNCREMGFSFMLSGAYDNDGKYQSIKYDDYFTWSVYEHRNSDQIIINGAVGMFHLAGDLPYMSDSKWDYLESFSHGKYEECAKRLAEMIVEKKNQILGSYENKVVAIHVGD